MGLPVSDDRIVEEEAKFGFRLPEIMRERLKRNNGGEITAQGEMWQLHPVWDPTNRKTITRSANHIVKETETARKWYDFPQGAIAIAFDGSGNYLIIRANSEDIEAWNHETGKTVPARIDNWEHG